MRLTPSLHKKQHKQGGGAAASVSGSDPAAVEVGIRANTQSVRLPVLLLFLLLLLLLITGVVRFARLYRITSVS
ncbi:hypothetical protein EYF80_049635 [Liparis tanakae]|uniref:Uncharacterized protein n=1 Tax=Liparis tanakae TaxID=230148 RepID=A0A4Z2FG68_9TELE|nr:hypothetical protein EYF80_049635 [Liparis tanakae]